MDIINNILVEALNVVGREFEKGTMFLPQLMMSAETVKNSFDAIKADRKSTRLNSSHSV